MLVYGAFIVVMLVLSFGFWCSSNLRNWVAKFDDFVYDDYEKAWLQYTKDTENAVFNLAVAHVIQQSIRFQITGIPPMATGKDPPGFLPTVWQAMTLEIISACCLVLYLVTEPFVPDWGRLKANVKGVIGNTFAFCFFFALSWYIKAFFNIFGNDQSLILALVTTTSVFLLIFILDTIADYWLKSPTLHREVQALVAPTSFLIGFSWKQATLDSIVILAKELNMHTTLSMHSVELLLAIGLTTLIVPAWRWYILPQVMKDTLEKAEQQHCVNPQKIGLQEHLLAPKELQQPQQSWWFVEGIF